VNTCIGKTCPYCHFPIKHEEAVTVCPSCRMPHHTECWQENGGCTVLGCASAPRPYATSDASTSTPPRLVITNADLGLGPRRLSPAAAWSLYAVITIVLIIGAALGLRHGQQYTPDDLEGPGTSDTTAVSPPDAPTAEEPSEASSDPPEPDTADGEWVAQTCPDMGITLAVPDSWVSTDQSSTDWFGTRWSDPQAEASVEILAPRLPSISSPQDTWQEMDRHLRLTLGDRYELISADSAILDGRDAVVSEFTLKRRDGTVLYERCFVATGGYLLLCTAPSEQFGGWEGTFTRIIDSVDLP